jgi:4-hydroxy-3-methylbut-2-enyl diphosphate reductase IspH
MVQIQHKMSWGELKETKDWLTVGKPVRIGVTSGASTPDRDVEQVLDKVFAIMVPDFKGIEPRAVAAPTVPAH